MSPAQQQTVQAVNGFAYGCIGADIHVFGDGVPLYVLQRWRPEVRPDASWLLDLPSRMLHSRFEVVAFTGREKELADLRHWRDHGPRLSVQWLHAPGGQGKSRLAAQFAKESEAAGWTAATAARGPGVAHPPPGSQDLRTDTRAGVLLVVDYADRWPVADLTWLLSNSILHRATDQARVLLLARGRDAWPAVRASIADLQADASTRALPPLDDGDGRVGDSERHGMFLAARDAFAALYSVPAYAIELPEGLSGPDFGLILAVHMAALVAVDRHAHAATAAMAPDMAGLTAYLLDRERRHWHTLHETGALGSTREEISRAAFVAALTGPLPYREAKAALKTAALDADADRLLTDHAYCYPPGASGTVLEPLYPDRLAEDFLALSLPGHHLPDHAADPWAVGIPELLLPAAESAGSENGVGRDGDSRNGLPSYAPRALVFLTAASRRWPHLLATLENLDARLPNDVGSYDELAAAAADLTERLAPPRLSATTDPAERARIHHKLGQRLEQADRAEKAAPAFAEATRLYRELAASAPQAFEAAFAESSFKLAVALVFADLKPWTRKPHENLTADAERLDQAAAAFRDATEVYRRLAAENPAEHRDDLVAALTVATFLVPRLGPSDLAMATALEVVDMVRHLADEEPDEWAHQLPYALVASAVALAGAHPEQARALADEAVGIARRMAHEDPEKHIEHLVFALSTQGSVLLRLERAEEAIDALSEAAELSGRGPQAGRHKDPWYEVMAHAISFVWMQERATGATTGRGTAVEVLSRLALGDTSGRGPALLTALTGLYGMLDASAGSEDVLTVHRAIIHLLRTSDEISYAGDDTIGRSDVLGVLVEASVLLARTGQWDEALAYLDEAAREIWVEGDHPLAASLGGALITMTAMLADLDPREDGDPYRRLARPQAVRVLERTAETYRHLAQDDPAGHELGLAVTAKILSEALWNLERRQEAVDIGREAVRTWRRCAARDSAADHRDQLALALRRLAAKLTDTGQAEQATTAAREAAALWRALFRESPSRHYPGGVAAALYLVALNLRRLRPAEALSAAEESAVLLTRFPADDPAEQHSVLATVNSLIAEIRSAERPGIYNRVSDERAQEHWAEPMARAIQQDGWLLLPKPNWEPSAPTDSLPTDAMVGGWQLDEEGRAGPFIPNPHYIPDDKSTPTDPMHELLCLVASGQGEGIGDQLLSTLRNTVVELACEGPDRLMVGPSPDGVPCVAVVTAAIHKRRLAGVHWVSVLGSMLPEIVPTGLDMLINPGDPAQIRLLTDALRESDS
ncbi:type VII secretion system-associated protein [Streptomyces sp. NBC_01244]|uniref:type VII secretion system-associated protein n=1 Tax=Streptomyces sp. NBC_01244 TaxID=2903797 RepID=UPI002E0E083E|nr:type VII secretion system-associated protein [Streptomyces sp. NBC_01244]